MAPSEDDTREVRTDRFTRRVQLLAALSVSYGKPLRTHESPVPRREGGGAREAAGWLELFGGLAGEVPRDLGGVAGVVGLVDA